MSLPMSDPSAQAAPGAPAQHPQGWYPDPFGRHETRWWDGQRWTEPTGPLCLALWGVNDPGNVGTLVFASSAFLMFAGIEISAVHAGDVGELRMAGDVTGSPDPFVSGA